MGVASNVPVVPVSKMVPLKFAPWIRKAAGGMRSRTPPTTILYRGTLNQGGKGRCEGGWNGWDGWEGWEGWKRTSSIH